MSVLHFLLYVNNQIPILITQNVPLRINAPKPWLNLIREQNTCWNMACVISWDEEIVESTYLYAQSYNAKLEQWFKMTKRCHDTYSFRYKTSGWLPSCISRQCNSCSLTFLYFHLLPRCQSNLPLRQCTLLVDSRNLYASIPIITEKSLFSFENKEMLIKICNPNFLSCFTLHLKISLTQIINPSLIT